MGKNHVPNHQPETHGTSAGDFTIFGYELQPVLMSWIDDHCSNPSTRVEENPATLQQP